MTDPSSPPASPCPDCGYTIGHTEICAGFARNDPANFRRAEADEASDADS